MMHWIAVLPVLPIVAHVMTRTFVIVFAPKKINSAYVNTHFNSNNNNDNKKKKKKGYEKLIIGVVVLRN